MLGHDATSRWSYKDFVESADRIALIAAVAATLALVGKLLAVGNLGFDFTDQGFYLNMIASPFDLPISLTQFGFIYHPLYTLLGGDIAALRQANLLISFLLAIGTTWSLLRRIARAQGVPSSQWSWPLAIVASAASVVSLVFISSMWLPTPSYNSLAFQSLLIAATGFCLAEKEASRLGLLGWLLIGLGCFLAFMAKPSTAALLGVLIVGFLWLDGRFSWRIMLSGAVAAILLATAMLLIAGSIPLFIENLFRNLAFAASLNAGHTISGIIRLDQFQLSTYGWIIFATITATLVVMTIGPRSGSLTVRSATTFAILTAVTVSTLIVTDIIDLRRAYPDSQGLQFFAILAAGAMGYGILSICGGSVLPRRLALIGFFALLPLAFTFGTAGNYWLGASSAAFFLTLASFACIAKPKADAGWLRDLMPLAIGSLAITSMCVQVGLANPYRESGPLSESTQAVRIGRSQSQVFLTKESAAYLSGLQTIARKAGFVVDTPMIDLTGHSPGALFALGAKPVGAAWMIGGYPGSTTWATAMLDLVSCERFATAWILREREGPRQLPEGLLNRYGIDTSRDYDVVGSIDTARRSYPTGFGQDILKPKRSAQNALLACTTAKTATTPATQ